MEGVVLNRVCILGIFCRKQDQRFKPSTTHLYTNTVYWSNTLSGVPRFSTYGDSWPGSPQIQP